MNMVKLYGLMFIDGVCMVNQYGLCMLYIWFICGETLKSMKILEF